MAKLVIVEADPTLANNLENALKDNFDINIALNGKDGLDTIVENKPDVAVLDFFLPELNGFQICTQLKQQGLLDNINVVLLVDSEDIGNRFVNQFGVKKYFLKPYNVDDIASFAIEMVSEEDISVADDGEDDDFPSFDDESLKLLDDIFADMETDGQPAEEPEEELPMLEEETSIDEKTEILSGPDAENSEDQAVVEAAPVTPDEVPPAAEASMDDELNVNAILGDLDDTLNSLDIDDDGSAGLGIDSGIPDIDEEDSLPTADDETIVADAMQADDAVPDIPEIDEAGPEIPDLDEIPEEEPQVEIPDLEDDIPQEQEAPVEEIPEIPDLDEAAATEEPELEIPDIEEAPAEEPGVEEIPTEEPPAEAPVEAAVEETVEEITADDLNLDIPDIEDEAPVAEPVVEEIPAEEPAVEVPVEAAVEETVEEITADDLNLDIPDVVDEAPAEAVVVEETPAPEPVAEPPAEAPVEAAVEETVEEITADDLNIDIPDIVEETPAPEPVVEPPAEVPVEAAVEAPVVEETPAPEPVVEPPVEAPVEAAVEAPVVEETPAPEEPVVVEPPVEAPVEAAVEAPVVEETPAPEEPVVEPPVEAPVEAAVEAPVVEEIPVAEPPPAEEVKVEEEPQHFDSSLVDEKSISFTIGQMITNSIEQQIQSALTKIDFNGIVQDMVQKAVAIQIEETMVSKDIDPVIERKVKEEVEKHGGTVVENQMKLFAEEKVRELIETEGRKIIQEKMDTDVQEIVKTKMAEMFKNLGSMFTPPTG